VLTVGHGAAAAAQLVALLADAGVRRVVDIRSFPGSRRHPQFGREEMQRWLPGAGIEYRWLASLGGRRRPDPASVHHALRHPAFRAYADHMEGSAFLDGVEELLGLDDLEATTVMCSESLWWRCHRRLLADHLTLVRGVAVAHVMHDGRRTPHPPTTGVRRDGSRVVYDVEPPEAACVRG
jgi:uncharacterized protein (DUF488 family)